MKDGPDLSDRELAYAWARHGAFALAARPYLQAGFEYLVRRLTRRQVILVLGALAAVFVIAGEQGRALPERIYQEGVYSQQPTDARRWRARLGEGRGQPAYVSFGVWGGQQVWRVLRRTSGLAFGVVGLVGWAALAERKRRDRLAEAFGADSPEYARFASPPDLDALDREDLRHDWLLSGVPRPGVQNADPDRERPRFGRAPARSALS